MTETRPDGVIEELRLLAVLRALGEHGVKYAAFGGVALGLHGLPRITADLDLFIEPTEDNVERLKARQRLARWFAPLSCRTGTWYHSSPISRVGTAAHRSLAFLLEHPEVDQVLVEPAVGSQHLAAHHQLRLRPGKSANHRDDPRDLRGRGRQHLEGRAVAGREGIHGISPGLSKGASS